MKSNPKNYYKILITIIGVIIFAFLSAIPSLAADVRYNEVAYACTHNAMCNADDVEAFPNQEYSIKHQLNDGVRALMIDIHYDYKEEDVVVMQHGDGFWAWANGHRYLHDGLMDIKTFLNKNPNEIITIIFESYVTAYSVKEEFRKVGLLSYLHTQPAGKPWPTIKQMISDNKRLVILTDKRTSRTDMDWYHYLWDNYAWETDYSASSRSDLSKKGSRRGQTHSSLFIFNHFLTGEDGGERDLADTVNYNSYFIDRAEKWMRRGRQIPNFVTVDFYNRGDIFKVVRQLNSISSPPANVNASTDLYNDRIIITWDACKAMVRYQIFRNTENNIKNATRIATGISSTHYTDTIVSSNQTYYYWIKADKYGLMTDYSKSTAGSCSYTRNVSSLSYTENFDDGTAHNATLLGTAVIESSSLKLTEDSDYQTGSLVLNKPAIGDNLYKSFSATFDMQIGSASRPGDGISFSLGNYANSGPFGENGNGNGLTVRFDTFNGDGDGKPAISIIKNGTVMSSITIDPYTDGRFFPIAIKLDNVGQIYVDFNGANIFSGFDTGFIPRKGDLFAFGARNGRLHEEHIIDNISIATLYGPKESMFDVVNPNNLITGSSSNYPENEGPSNVIDRNPTTKYLNFDKEYSGFTVIPATIPTMLGGIVLTTANDHPERDPASVTIRGSNDGNRWFDIVKDMNTPLSDTRLFNSLFTFNNNDCYEMYQIIFPTLKDSDSANSVQIAEIKLFGEQVPEPCYLLFIIYQLLFITRKCIQ